MALKTLTNITDTQLKAYGVSALATRPNAPSTYGEGGLSAEELKARFDNLGKMLAKAINDINTALSTDGASYISLEIGAEIKSLADLSKAYLDGTFANVLKAYEKATDIGDTAKLKTLQTILSGFSQRIAEVESVGDITTLEQAKAYADTKDIATLATAKTYADTQDTANLATAKTYADTQDTTNLASAKAYADSQDTTNLASAKTYADTELAKLINSAPATFDTLKEIADWIASDESGTSALIARVTALEDDYSGSSGSSTVSFTQASTRVNIVTGETLAVLMGKVKKWFADLGTLAFKSSLAYSEVTGTPTLGTLASKSSLDYSELTSKPTLGTVASKNTGTTQGTIPVIGSSGKIDRYILPTATDSGYIGVVAGQNFANRNKAGATYHEVLIDSAGMAYAFYPNIDTAMSDSSINLVQNKVVKAYVDTAESSAKAYVDGIVGDIETLLAGV